MIDADWWRNRANQYRADAAETQTRYDSALTELEDCEQALTTHLETIRGLQAEVADLRREPGQIAALTAELATVRATATTATRHAAALEVERDLLRARTPAIVDLQRAVRKLVDGTELGQAAAALPDTGRRQRLAAQIGQVAHTAGVLDSQTPS